MTGESAARPKGNPIVFVAGMSRAGSMWTYNATRHLLAAAGYEVEPKEIPPNVADVIQDILGRDYGPETYICLKTHKLLEPIPPTVRVISPYRDVRDATLSFMKFMKCSFEDGLSAARDQMRIADYYLSQRQENVLPLRYDEIIGAPTATLVRIARFLDIEVGEEIAERITADLALSKVQSQLDKLAQVTVDADGNVSAKASSSGYRAISNLDGSHRIFDSATGFQSNHITTGKEGAWKDELSEEQQAELLSLTRDWLARHGFTD